MGIIVFGFGMAGPLGNFAGLLQMTMHSLTKSAIFFSVGHVAQVKGTQRIAEMGGLTESHPVLGWALVAGVALFRPCRPSACSPANSWGSAPAAPASRCLGWRWCFGSCAHSARCCGSGNGVRAGARADGAGACVLGSGVRPPRAGAGRGSLYLPPLVAWFQHVAALLG